MHPDVLADLANSGILPSHMNIRPLTSAEIAAVGPPANVGYGLEGYVIPYFDLKGQLLPYYRVKFLGNVKPKYKAVRNQENHIYFPPGLPKLLARPECDYLIITEGEKKAACAVAHGFPCIALSGVDSWRVRTISIPDTSELIPFESQGIIKAKLPAGDSHNIIMQETGVSAVGFMEVVELAIKRDLCLVIIFDTDEEGVRVEVQKAAAILGYELRYQGVAIPNIRQAIMVPQKGVAKIGLDDFIVKRGVQSLAALISAVRGKRNAFPAHPNVRGFISGKLQGGRMSRKEVQDVAMSILVELEAAGRRLRNTDTQETFYFDNTTHTLMHVMLNNPRVPLHDTSFGAFLYRKYNLSAADTRVIDWLATQYSGEDGVEDTTTHKVITRHPAKPTQIAYQLSDTHYILISGNPDIPFEICTNGTNGILFEQGQVEAINHKALELELHTQLDQPLEMKWLDVINGFNFSVDTDVPTSRMAASVEQSKVLMALLFYISPWLLRWKGTQLPIELVIGEPGSGKSSLYGLRQQILVGRIRLTNLTKDIRDWYAGITSRGGIYVLDNVKFTTSDKDYQQRLSDELCRLVTEPDPRVEMRKLYTTSDVASVPVSATFAVTSVTQPFFAVDLLQRSAIFEMQAIASAGTHDASWMNKMLEAQGGRVGWLAHQLVVLHKFLFHATWLGEWDDSFGAGHRLANYEQALILTSRIFGQDPSWIPSALKLRTEHSVAETDWTLSALSDYIDDFKEADPEGYAMKEFSVSDIIAWAIQHETHSKNATITNAWKLGKYIKSNLAMIRTSYGMYESGKRANKQMYKVYVRANKPLE